MPGERIVVSIPDFKDVHHYVSQGLPKDSWFRDVVGSVSRKKMWYDYSSHSDKHEYDEYEDPDVIYAARFRDGLVSDSDVFPHSEFLYALRYEFWAEEYKKNQKSFIVMKLPRSLMMLRICLNIVLAMNIKVLLQ